MDIQELLEPLNNATAALKGSLSTTTPQDTTTALQRPTELNELISSVEDGLSSVLVSLQNHTRKQRNHDGRDLDVYTTITAVIRMMFQRVLLVEKELGLSIPEEEGKRMKRRFSWSAIMKRKVTESDMRDTRAWLSERETLVLLFEFISAILQGEYELRKHPEASIDAASSSSAQETIQVQSERLQIRLRLSDQAKALGALGLSSNKMTELLQHAEDFAKKRGSAGEGSDRHVGEHAPSNQNTPDVAEASRSPESSTARDLHTTSLAYDTTASDRKGKKSGGRRRGSRDPRLADERPPGVQGSSATPASLQRLDSSMCPGCGVRYPGCACYERIYMA